MGRGDLSEAEWELIGPLLPSERGRWARPSGDNRRFLNGMLHVLRVGCPWRDMHERYGKWNSVYVRFRRWKEWRPHRPRRIGQITCKTSPLRAGRAQVVSAHIVEPRKFIAPLNQRNVE